MQFVVFYKSGLYKGGANLVYYDEIKKSLRYNNAVNGGNGMKKAVFIKACWILAQVVTELAGVLI